jgi:hypothetical protein
MPFWFQKALHRVQFVKQITVVHMGVVKKIVATANLTIFGVYYVTLDFIRSAYHRFFLLSENTSNYGSFTLRSLAILLFVSQTVLWPFTFLLSVLDLRSEKRIVKKLQRRSVFRRLSFWRKPVIMLSP